MHDKFMNDCIIDLYPGRKWEYRGCKFECIDNEKYLFHSSYRILIIDKEGKYHTLRHGSSRLSINEFFDKFVTYCKMSSTYDKMSSICNKTDDTCNKIYGVWLDYPANKPDNGERVLIRRKGYSQNWELAVYNEDYKCWDDGEGDDYFCDLESVDKFMLIPKIC